MEPSDTVSDGQAGDAQAPDRADDTPVGQPTSSSDLKRNRPSRRQSTKGGSGSAAGATPKKEHRPATSSGHRPAGKKPDPGRY
jgi:hypothetical protein